MVECFMIFSIVELLWLQPIKKSKIGNHCNNWGLVSWIKINFMVIIGKKKSADAIKQSSGHHLALHEWVAYCRTKPAGRLQGLYDNDIDSTFTPTFIFTSIVFILHTWVCALQQHASLTQLSLSCHLAVLFAHSSATTVSPIREKQSCSG